MEFFNGNNNMPQNCPEPINRQVFDCGEQQTIIKHQHIVKHRHNIINEYDVVHEHDYNHFDVVNQRNVVRHNDCTTHQPNYCCNEQNRPSPRNIFRKW